MRRSTSLIAALAGTGLALIAPSSVGAADENPVPYTSTWKVLDNGTNQTGSALPAATHFASLAYDDSAWTSHTVQSGKVLGYGDNSRTNFPTQTPNLSFGPASGNKYITTYFRTTFDITDAASISSLTLNLRRDDGAVVYLNGAEVFRTNMPAGAVTYTTFAPTIIDSAAEYTPVTTSLPVNQLVNGSNLLAIELHQRDGTSSDVTFAAELTATTLAPVVPEVPLPILLPLAGLVTAGGVVLAQRRRTAAAL